MQEWIKVKHKNRVDVRIWREENVVVADGDIASKWYKKGRKTEKIVKLIKVSI